MKFLLGIALALGVSAVAYAAAANLVVNSGTLQQGTDMTLACTEGATVNFQNEYGTTNADVVVTGIDTDCAGAYLYVEIFDADENRIYACPADAGSETPPPGGVLIPATGIVTCGPVVGDADFLVNVQAADSVKVTIIGGGTTNTTNPVIP